MGEKDTAYIRQRLKLARESMGWSQQDMAQRFKMSQSKISNLELGRVQIGIDDLIDFARMTGKPFSFFLPPGLLMGSPDLNFNEETLLALYREIDDESFHQAIIGFVRDQVVIYRNALAVSALPNVSQQEKMFRMLDTIFNAFDFDVTEEGEIRVLSGDAQVLLSMTQDIDKEELKAYLRWREVQNSSSSNQTTI